MNETTFLSEMQNALGGLPYEQREDILSEYRSHFFEGKERGKSDEEIARSLGDPRAVARSYIADYHYSAWRSPAPGQSVGKSFSHLIRAVFVTFSLLFFNFFFMLVPVLLYCVFLGLAWLMTGLSVFLGIIFFFYGLVDQGGSAILTSNFAQFALIFYSLGTVALGSLVGLGLFALSRLSIRALMKYIKININLAKA
jgi:uncharacterized membrane protein